MRRIHDAESGSETIQKYDMINGIKSITKVEI